MFFLLEKDRNHDGLLVNELNHFTAKREKFLDVLKKQMGKS